MLIGICGKKQTGKNTVAEYLSNTLTKKTNVVSFATPVLNIAGVLANDDFRINYEEKKKTFFPNVNLTGRELLQKVGTEWGRSLNPNIWVNLLFNKIDDAGYKMYYKHTIISDVRFKNEADEILKRGGILIKLERNTGLSDNHISENDLDDYDKPMYVIDNNGTLEQLKQKLEIVVESIP